MQHDKQVSNVLLLPDEMPCISHLCAFRSPENRVQIEIQSSGSQKKYLRLWSCAEPIPVLLIFQLEISLQG